MKLMILNAIPDGSRYSDIEQGLLESIAKDEKNEIEHMMIRDLDINYCTGCWDCWVKTPGICALHDDQIKILSRYPKMDLVIFITPVVAGYESFLLKRARDRLIPLVHPYIQIHKGEQHHIQRYNKNPDIGLIVIKDDDEAIEELELIHDTYKRMTLNIISDLKFFRVVGKREELRDVFDNI